MLMKEANALHIILLILLACLVIILVLFLILLLAPLHYRLDLSFEQFPPQFNFSLKNCCYGLEASLQESQLILAIMILGFKRQLNKQSPENNTLQSAKAKRETVKKPSKSPNLLKEFMHNRDLKEHFINLIKGIWHIIHPRKMVVKARVGFDEPHYTGWLMAAAGMLQTLNQSYTIQLEGVWDEPCLEGEALLIGSMIPVQLLWQGLKFLLQPETRSFLKRFRSKKSLLTQQAAA